MDIATGAGLLIGVIVLTVLVLLGGDFRIFYDIHAVIIIFGGSFAATLIRFPFVAIIHGMPTAAWKARNHTPATPEQLARMEESMAKNP